MPTPFDATGASPAIHLHAQDNVLIARRDIAMGETVAWDGGVVTASSPIPLGHKLALVDLTPASPVLKYGVSIGAVTQAVKAGDHVHLHNMRSDYIATHSRQSAVLKEEF